MAVGGGGAGAAEGTSPSASVVPAATKKSRTFLVNGLRQPFGNLAPVALYLFFDESGDLNFSPAGSRYYFFGALTTRDPERLTNPLSRLQYQLLADGLEIERFHASEDRLAVRDRVFDGILATGGFDFDAAVIEKRNARAVLDDEARFYQTPLRSPS